MAKRKDTQAAIAAAAVVQANEVKKLTVAEVAGQARAIINACAAQATANADHKRNIAEFDKNTGAQVLQLAQSSDLGSFINGMELAAAEYKATNKNKNIPPHFTQYKSDVKAGFELGVNFDEHATYSSAKKAINEKRLAKKAKAEGTVQITIPAEMAAYIRKLSEAYKLDASAVGDLVREDHNKLDAILKAVVPNPPVAAGLGKAA